MTQAQRRVFLIKALLEEQSQYRDMPVPAGESEQRRLLRSLMNIRPPRPIGEDLLAVQDEYLRTEAAARGVTDIADLTPAEPGLYLWQGDITTLRCGAIVNAANSGLTGCYIPCHGCIDNAIHTFAGMRLRLKCAELVGGRGMRSPPGGPSSPPPTICPATIFCTP